LEGKFCELIVSTITENQNDHRIVHTGLTVLHNLSISDANKIVVASKGGILAATNSLKVNSLLIQYEAIGILKCLLSGNVPKDHRIIFSELGGIQALVSIVTTHLSDNAEEKPDPRVMYEACRLLCRLCEHENVLKIVGSDAVPIFMVLVTTNYSLLQCEGTQALYKLSSKDEYQAAVVQQLPSLVAPLQKETLSHDTHAKLTVLFVLRTLSVLHTQGYKEATALSTSEVVKAWASKNKGAIDSEITSLLTQILS